MKRMNIYLTEELIKAITERAKGDMVQKSKIIEDAVRKYLKMEKK